MAGVISSAGPTSSEPAVAFLALAGHVRHRLRIALDHQQHRDHQAEQRRQGTRRASQKALHGRRLIGATAPPSRPAKVCAERLADALGRRAPTGSHSRPGDRPSCRYPRCRT